MRANRMKTPLTYYGGKQTLAPLIISLFPQHTLYAEPFTGGGAVFFHKPPSKVEVLNDTNGELMNFYRVVRHHFASLQKRIQQTLHSRDAHRKAIVIYNNPDLFGPISRAWAVWVLCAMSFASKMDGPYGYDKKSNTTSKKVAYKREGFLQMYATRLEKVQIECADALYIIKSRDYPEAFFYCDPPYVGSDCGHYKGYTEAEYEALLGLLSSISGKFLLSSYPSDVLAHYIETCQWNSLKRDMLVSVNAKVGNPKKKTEVLTANYPLQSQKNESLLLL